jgi:membrane protein YdbS with pleckstrin-like domain
MRTKLKRGEEVVYIARRHWFTLFKPTLFLLLSVVITPVVYGKWGQFLDYIVIGVVMVAIGNFIYRIYDRKFDIWVVTNRRIIDEWGVISHNYKENPIEKINNINVQQSVTGRMFGFGTVEIQTAAEDGNTTIQMVESPVLLQEAILDVMESIGRTAVMPEIAQGDYRECPFCAEIIKKKAKVCRFCGRELPADDSEKTNTQQGLLKNLTENHSVQFVSPADTEKTTEEKSAEKETIFDPKTLWR